MQQENKILISAILIILLGVVAFNFNSNLSGAVSKTGDIMVTVKDNCARTGSMTLKIEAPVGEWEKGYVKKDGIRLSTFRLERDNTVTVRNSQFCRYKGETGLVTIENANRRNTLSKKFKFR